MINVIKHDIKFGASPHGDPMLPREKIYKYKLYAKWVFYPIALNFMLVGPLLPAHDFSATMASTYSLIVWDCVLPTIFGDWKYPLNYCSVAYCRQMVKCGPAEMRACRCTDVNRQMVGFSRITRVSRVSRVRVRIIVIVRFRVRFSFSDAKKQPRIPAGQHFTHNQYCRPDNARRAALVAMLPDNCHPSSYFYCLLFRSFTAWYNYFYLHFYAKYTFR